MDENDFSKACKKGDLTLAKDLLAKYLLTLRPISDIFANNAESFRVVCAHDYLDMAKWLLEIHSTINISADDEYAFRAACFYDYLPVINWLLHIKPNIDIRINDDNEAFRDACENGAWEVAKLLRSINPNYNFEYKKAEHHIINSGLSPSTWKSIKSTRKPDG